MFLKQPSPYKSSSCQEVYSMMTMILLNLHRIILRVLNYIVLEIKDIRRENLLLYFCMRSTSLQIN